MDLRTLGHATALLARRARAVERPRDEDELRAPCRRQRHVTATAMLSYRTGYGFGMQSSL